MVKKVAVNKKRRSELDVKKNKRISGRKIHLNVLKTKNDKNILWVNRYFSKRNVIYFILGLIDVVLIVYVAKKNVVNYVSLAGEEIFISETKNLLLGRNYITLVITFFFFGYTCLLNHFILKNRNSRNFLIVTFFLYLILNVVLFGIFTRKIY